MLIAPDMHVPGIQAPDGLVSNKFESRAKVLCFGKEFNFIMKHLHHLNSGHLRLGFQMVKFQ
jgi:hypothetical protein